MTPAPWQIEVLGTSATKAWYELPDALRDQIVEELLRDPYYDPDKPKCRSHLKGKIGGKDCECNREYKDLENARRILYKVDKRHRVMLIWYVGPHQKEKPKRGSGRH